MVFKRIISAAMALALAALSFFCALGYDEQDESILWHQNMIKLDKARSILGNGNQDIKVAIIDTGIDASHPSLKGRVKYHFDISNNFECPNKNHENCAHNDALESSHGTHVAGVIAGGQYAGEYLDFKGNSIGIAPNVSLLDIKVFGKGLAGSNMSVQKGIEKAIELKADVINLSIGGSGYVTLDSVLIAKADSAGCLIVAACGNESSESAVSPAHSSGAISVTGVDQTAMPANFTNFGWGISIAAPAVDIFSTVLDNDYFFDNGTSMAAPIVSASAALLKSKYPFLSSSQLRDIIMISADRSKIKSRNDEAYYGSGIIDLYAAAKLAESMKQDKGRIIEIFNPIENNIAPAIYDGSTCFNFVLNAPMENARLRAHLYNKKGSTVGISEWIHLKELGDKPKLIEQKTKQNFAISYDFKSKIGTLNVIYDYTSMLGEELTLGDYEIWLEAESNGRKDIKKQKIAFNNPIYDGMASPNVMTQNHEIAFKASFKISPILKQGIQIKNNCFAILARDISTRKRYILSDFKLNEEKFDAEQSFILPLKVDGAFLPNGQYALMIARYEKDDSGAISIIDEMRIDDFSIQKQVNVKIISNEGGKVSISIFNQGKPCYIFTPSLNSGYEVKAAYVNGIEKKLKNGKLVVENPLEDLEIEFTFK